MSGLAGSANGKSWIVEPGGLGSVRLCAGKCNDLRPLFGLFCDEFFEVGRRDGKYRNAELGKLPFQLEISQAGIDFTIEPVDDLPRSVPRCTDTVPATSLISRNKLTHGRNIRQRRGARCRGHRQRAQL